MFGPFFLGPLLPQLMTTVLSLPPSPWPSLRSEGPRDLGCRPHFQSSLSSSVSLALCHPFIYPQGCSLGVLGRCGSLLRHLQESCCPGAMWSGPIHYGGLQRPRSQGGHSTPGAFLALEAMDVGVCSLASVISGTTAPLLVLRENSACLWSHVQKALLK